MLEQIWKLKPIKTDHKYIEQIILLIKSTYGYYPHAMLHIDTLYDPYNREIYDKLNDGKDVIVRVRFEVLEGEE